LLLLASLIFSVLVLSRLLNHSWDVALGAVAIFSAWFAPFASDMRVANVNSLQLAAIAAYLCVLRFSGRYRDVFGGAILALAVAFKPNIVFIPAMLAISWIVNGRFRRVVQFAIGAVVGLAIASAMTVASFGSLRCWADWISAVRALPAEIISVEYGNFAPARMLSEWLGINVAIPAAIVFGGLALWAIQQGRQKNTTMSEPASSHDFATDGLAISLGCLLVVLVSRLAWLHYYVLMIPVILAALSPNDSLGRYPGIRHLLIGLTLFGYAFDSLRFLSLMPPPNVQSILVVVPTVILFGLTIRNAVSFNRVRGSR
jgi:hypothetical protein